jgi:hypothetical protein
MPSKNFHRAPTYVDVTFKGASRRACRVGKPTSVELVINLKTAKAPGGHFKLLHLWPVKLLQAGRFHYELLDVSCAMRAAASLSR